MCGQKAVKTTQANPKLLDRQRCTRPDCAITAKKSSRPLGLLKDFLSVAQSASCAMLKSLAVWDWHTLIALKIGEHNAWKKRGTLQSQILFRLGEGENGEHSKNLLEYIIFECGSFPLSRPRNI